MQINTEHLHHWMCAIRESKDPIRTMDAFWRGQIKSKEWLIQEFNRVRNHTKNWPDVDIHGGWVGVLASMLFQSNIPVTTIRSIDIDPLCQHVASLMNKKEEIEGRFRAVTGDMCNIRSDADIIINTSCEHITQTEYDIWLSRMSSEQLLVLQSNNYDIPEHVRIASSLNDFIEQSKLRTIIYKGLLQLPLYDRYMVIGRV